MTRWFLVLVLATASTFAAEEKFSSALPAQAFASAGLGKLTPEELARLDRLVSEYKNGSLADARRELAAAEARAQQAQAKAAQAEANARAAKIQGPDTKSPSLLERARVLLKPGTQIEYTTLESRLASDFVGWERNTVFTLENGQRWRAVGSSSYVTPPMPPPRVKVVPGALGTFWMEIEGVRQRVKVESLDSK